MIIYKITNKINGMAYIGQTKRTLETRWKDHINASRCANSEAKFKLQRAILEHGAENFTVEQIDIATTPEEADLKEMYWINHFGTFGNGYNSNPGGKNGGGIRKVRNVETGVVFESVEAAAEFVGRTRASMYQALKRGYASGGYHWVWAE